MWPVVHMNVSVSVVDTFDNEKCVRYEIYSVLISIVGVGSIHGVPLSVNAGIENTCSGHTDIATVAW